MGRRGPAPKPTALRLVPGGNPGRRELPRGEPIPPAGLPDPPAFLDDAARAWWTAMAPQLAAVGLLRRIDGVTFARYCVTLSLWEEAIQLCRTKGTTFAVRAAPTKAQREAGAEGRILAVKEFPWTQQVRKLNQQLIVLEREFGLTPAARTRINVEADQTAKGSVDKLRAKFLDPRVGSSA